MCDYLTGVQIKQLTHLCYVYTVGCIFDATGVGSSEKKRPNNRRTSPNSPQISSPSSLLYQRTSPPNIPIAAPSRISPPYPTNALTSDAKEIEQRRKRIPDNKFVVVLLDNQSTFLEQVGYATCALAIGKDKLISLLMQQLRNQFNAKLRKVVSSLPISKTTISFHTGI